MRSLIKLLVFASLTCICLVTYAKSNEYKIWYIPLDRNYYAPVTSESIEGYADKKLTKTSTKIDFLFTEAEKKAEFKNLKPQNDFRIKLIRTRDNKVLYINRDKSVIIDGGIANVPSDVVREAIKIIEKKKK